MTNTTGWKIWNGKEYIDNPDHVCNDCKLIIYGGYLPWGELKLCIDCFGKRDKVVLKSHSSNQ